jgi:hypothetical protein
VVLTTGGQVNSDVVNWDDYRPYDDVLVEAWGALPAKDARVAFERLLAGRRERLQGLRDLLAANGIGPRRRRGLTAAAERLARPADAQVPRSTARPRCRVSHVRQHGRFDHGLPATLDAAARLSG